MKLLKKFLLGCGSVLLTAIIVSPMYSWRVNKANETEWLRHGKAEAEKQEADRKAELKKLHDIIYGYKKI